MRKVGLLVLLWAIAISARAQEHGFELQKGALVWKASYESTLTSAEIIRELQILDLIEVTYKDSITLAGTTKRIPNKWKEMGHKRMWTPMYVTMHDIICRARIETNEQGYVVKLDKFTLQTVEELSNYEKSTLEFYALQDGRISPTFGKKYIRTYHKSLLDYFSIE